MKTKLIICVAFLALFSSVEATTSANTKECVIAVDGGDPVPVGGPLYNAALNITILNVDIDGKPFHLKTRGKKTADEMIKMYKMKLISPIDGYWE